MIINDINNTPELMNQWLGIYTLSILELKHQWHGYGNGKELYCKTTKGKHFEIY